MKTTSTRSTLIAAVLGAASIAGLMLAQAQETTSSDSIVALAADSQSLSQVAPSSVPVRGATFWFAYPAGITVPAPCLPLDNPGAPIYGITSDEFLVDLTGGTVMVTPLQLKEEAQATNAYAAAVTAQVQGLINLITWIQTPTPMAKVTTEVSPTAKFAKFPSQNGGGISAKDQTQGYPYLTIGPTGTNGVYLITVFNNQGPANYEIWYTPVLANPDYPWTAVVAGTTGQTNFSINLPVYPTGFYRAIWDTNSVPAWDAADPHNPGAGVLAVFIDSPTNGAVIQ